MYRIYDNETGGTCTHSYDISTKREAIAAYKRRVKLFEGGWLDETVEICLYRDDEMLASTSEPTLDPNCTSR